MSNRLIAGANYFVAIFQLVNDDDDDREAAQHER